MNREPLPEPIVITLTTLHAVAVEIFDVTATCLQTGEFSADDWELLRLNLAAASQALTTPPRFKT
jgi:hypothetical protein